MRCCRNPDQYLLRQLRLTHLLVFQWPRNPHLVPEKPQSMPGTQWQPPSVLEGWVRFADR